MDERRHFSGGLDGRNLRTLGSRTEGEVRRVGFLLLEHFSLASFTGAVDVLVTANLLAARELYQAQSLVLADGEALSDLGILIKPDARISAAALADLDLLLVCGGLRTPLRPQPALERLLGEAARRGLPLGGLWNGAWFLARAGLLGGRNCTIHPENRTALAEASPASRVLADGFVVDGDRLSAASPNGASQLMLQELREQHGEALARGVEEILAFEGLRFRRVGAGHAKARLSDALRRAVELMENNLEEPLELDQLADYVGLSRRQLDRLFQRELATSQHRYYLELRITEARRLLQHSALSITEVAVACGFASSNHFSRCYRDYFGHSPSREVRLAP